MVQNEFTIFDFLAKKTNDVLQEVREMNSFKKGVSLTCEVFYPEKGDKYSYPDLFKLNTDLDLVDSARIGSISIRYIDHEDKEVLRSRKVFLVSQGIVHKNLVLILADYNSDSVLLIDPKVIEREKIDLTAEKRAIKDFWVLMRNRLIGESKGSKFDSHIVVTLT